MKIHHSKHCRPIKIILKNKKKKHFYKLGGKDPNNDYN